MRVSAEVVAFLVTSDAGFEVLALNGGFAGERFELATLATLATPRLVLTARRE